MPKKQLIVANDVRAAAKSGSRVIALSATALVTAEARSVAKDLGIALGPAEPSLDGSEQTEVRLAVQAQLGGVQADDAAIAEIARRVAIERARRRQSHTGTRNEQMDLMQACEASAARHPARVVFPDALDRRAIEAAAELSRRGWARPVLLADPQALRTHCREHGLEVPRVDVVDPAKAVGGYAAELRRKRPELSDEQGRTQLTDPLWYGAMMLVRGDADYCVAGNLSATASVLRAGLRVIGLADGIGTVSSMFFMIPGDRSTALAFGDCGVVPEPTTEQLADIAISTAANYRAVTGEVPRVAMLSFSTLGSAKHASADSVREAVALVKAREPHLLIDGELQFDAAFIPHVAAQKAPGSDVAGSANVFIFPSLAAGNIAYKVAERLAGYTALGPMIQGLRLPMHDLSRGCSAADIVKVALLAMKMGSPQSPSSRTQATGEAGSSAKALSV